MDSALPPLDLLPVSLFVKVLFLVIIALYFLFVFLAFVQVRALNRMVTITAGKESVIAQTIFFIYILLVASLFLFSIVIL